MEIFFFFSIQGNDLSDDKCQFKGQSLWVTVDIYLPSFEIFMRGPRTAKACSDLTFKLTSLSGMLSLKENCKGHVSPKDSAA